MSQRLSIVGQATRPLVLLRHCRRRLHCLYRTEKENIVGIVIAIVSMLSLASLIILTTNGQAGWGRLAETYKSQAASTPMQWRFVSARMGRGSSVMPYRAALNIGVEAEGLHLSLFPLFRLGALPLFIPWEDVSVSQEGVSSREIEFHFQDAPDVFLRLGKTVGADIVKYKHGQTRSS
jgi:hypothetical protein